jgi:sugar phosphate isomerase/epimerase
MNFGINLSFAVKRWPEPEIWAKMVRETIGVEQVQFTFDLLDPWTPEPMRSSMAEKISQSTMNWGIRIESAFGGLASYTYNNLLHPDIDGRRISIEWWKRAMDLTVKIGSSIVGGPLGGMSITDAVNINRKKTLYNILLDEIAELTHIAKNSGIKKFYIECTPLAREIPYSIEQAKRLINDLTNRCEVPIEFLIDVGHALYQPLYGEKADLNEWLRDLNPYIGALHLQNTDYQSDSHWGWPNNQGLFDVELFVKQLQIANLQDVPCFLEVIYPFEMDDEEVKRNVISSVQHCKKYFI